MSLPDQPGLGWAAFSSPLASPLAGGGAAAPAGGVRSAIARAAGATGVDFSYLLAQARMESGLNPNARAATSSASGLYQFTNATWMQTVQKHGDLLDGGVGGGLGRGLPGGGVSTLAALSDPAARAQMLALRSDPNASAMMAASLAADNQSALTGVLGRTPDASELYLAHFLGSDGAGRFLTALAGNPDQSAAALLPKAACANGAIFFDGQGAPRSLGQVMALIRSRMDAALQGAGQGAGQDAGQGAGQSLGGAGDVGADYGGYGAMRGAASDAPAISGGPIAQEWAQAQNQMAPVASSMADTLAATFGGAGEGGGGERGAGERGAGAGFVREAYARLKAFGL